MEDGITALIVVLSVLLALFICLCIGERWSKLKMQKKYEEELSEERRKSETTRNAGLPSPPIVDNSREVVPAVVSPTSRVIVNRAPGKDKIGKGRGVRLQVKSPVSSPAKASLAKPSLMKSLINKLKKQKVPFDNNDTIKLGSEVEIHGLRARQDMNGLLGTVVEVGDAGRTSIVNVNDKWVRFPRQNIRLQGTKTALDNKISESEEFPDNPNAINPLDALSPPAEDIISSHSVHDEVTSTVAGVAEHPPLTFMNVKTPIQTPIDVPLETFIEKSQVEIEEETTASNELQNINIAISSDQTDSIQLLQGEPASTRDTLTAKSDIDGAAAQIRKTPQQQTSSPSMETLLSKAMVAGINDVADYQQIPLATLTTTPTPTSVTNTITLTPSQLLRPGVIMHTVRDEPTSPPTVT